MVYYLNSMTNYGINSTHFNLLTSNKQLNKDNNLFVKKYYKQISINNYYNSKNYCDDNNNKIIR